MYYFNKKEQFKKAKNYALKLLSIRARTVFEVKERLKQKEYPDSIIKEVVDYLIKAGYLDDQTYVCEWLESRIKNKPCGRVLCYKKLREKGIKKEIIIKFLDKKLSIEKEKILALKLAENKKKEYGKASKKKNAQKTAFFLQSRGFSSSSIAFVLENGGYFSY